MKHVTTRFWSWIAILTALGLTTACQTQYGQPEVTEEEPVRRAQRVRDVPRARPAAQPVAQPRAPATSPRAGQPRRQRVTNRAMGGGY